MGLKGVSNLVGGESFLTICGILLLYERGLTILVRCHGSRAAHASFYTGQRISSSLKSTGIQAHHPHLHFTFTLFFALLFSCYDCIPYLYHRRAASGLLLLCLAFKALGMLKLRVLVASFVFVGELSSLCLTRSSWRYLDNDTRDLRSSMEEGFELLLAEVEGVFL